MAQRVEDLEHYRVTSEARLARLEDNTSTLEMYEDNRLDLCIGNTFVMLGRKLAKEHSLDSGSDPSPNRLQSVARKVSDKQLIKSGVASKYWQQVRRLDEVTKSSTITFDHLLRLP